MRIAYLCSLLPAVSHTFVLREIECLRRRGVDISTFSIHRAGREHLLSAADRRVFDTTYAILPVNWRVLIATHLRLLARSPWAYLSTLTSALRRGGTGVRDLLWQLFYFVEAIELWRECDRLDIRHIHVHMGNVGADAAMLAAQLGSAVQPAQPWSWSLSLHGPDELFDVSQFRIAEKASRALFVRCASDFARSQLMAVSSPEQSPQLHVVRVGVPLEQFTRQQGPPPADHPPEILFVGRLVPQKGHVTLLEATALVRERGHEVQVVLAGEGPSRSKLETTAEHLGIADCVSFLGAVGQEEINGLYESASIFCLPSFAEGLPTVLMEAMAMELAVVSTDINGVPELVEHGKSGLLVTPGRADQLADALAALIDDPERRRALGSAARETVLEHFDLAGSVQGVHDLLVKHVGLTRVR
jgi:colanic acid/amylovoran biosynthesis glycosyltransferase